MGGNAKEAPEYFQTIGITQGRAAGPFGVRHHAKHIPACITNACNVLQSAVRVALGGRQPCFVAVIIQHLVVGDDGIQYLRRGIVPSFTMRDGYGKHLFLIAFTARAKPDIAAYELLTGIPEQDSR